MSITLLYTRQLKQLRVNSVAAKNRVKVNQQAEAFESWEPFKDFCVYYA